MRAPRVISPKKFVPRFAGRHFQRQLSVAGKGFHVAARGHNRKAERLGGANHEPLVRITAASA